jgi:bifunctional UDP-N-acetylglucosamine pyrophosphorylase/glucosamine-1-phosphate N-acetyltransferase
LKRTFATVVLAAGEGTRMKSRLPKVLHPAAGVPMLHRVFAALKAAGAARQAVVVGHGAELVQASLPMGVSAVLQPKRLGTGHAVRCAEEALKGFRGTVLVAAGDSPLLTAATLKELIRRHHAARAAATVLTAVLPDGGAYGRIVRGTDGRLEAIVEAKDATPAQRGIREVNSGLYCFEAGPLWKALRAVKPSNAQGEYYLTDVIALLLKAGHHAAAWACPDPDEVRGVNNREELAWASARLRRRKLSALMAEGVTVTDPDNTFIDDTVKVGRDSVIEPYTFLQGATVVGEGCVVGPFSRVLDSRLEGGSVVLQSVVEGSVVGPQAKIGPWSRLRPGSRVGKGAKIGNFVELKKAVLAEGVKAGHLSYLGDVTVGAEANIGCGTITANYDGKAKHATVIGAGAFTGSGTVLVAPVKMGRNSRTGAGAVVLKGRDVRDHQTVAGVPARPLKP